jgi:hypothetical protein
VFSMRHGRDMEADLEQQLKEKEGDEDAMREHLQVGSLTMSITQARNRMGGRPQHCVWEAASIRSIPCEEHFFFALCRV